MTCNARWERELTSALLSDPSSAKARGVREHLKTCPACQGAWERQRQIAEAAGSLRSVAPRADARATVLARCAATDVAREGRAAGVHGRWRPRPAAVWIAAALFALAAVAIAVACGRLGSQQGITAFQRDGHTWQVSSSYSGVVCITDAAGVVLARLGPNWPPIGRQETRVAVDSQEHVFRGEGFHKVRDATGGTLGYVCIREASLAELRQALRDRDQPIEQSAGACGIEGGAGLVRGFDKAHGLVFEVRGRTAVAYTEHETGRRVSARAKGTTEPAPGPQAPSPSTALPGSETPSVTWTVMGKTTRREGYGTYKIADGQGKPIATLQVTR